MPSQFLNALDRYIGAERDYWWALHPQNEDPSKDVAASDKALAQAGDVLEREIRQMMREEHPICREG